MSAQSDDLSPERQAWRSLGKETRDSIIKAARKGHAWPDPDQARIAVDQLLAEQHRQASAANNALQTRVDKLEEDLTAAGTSLRRVLKETNRQPQ